MPDWTYTLHDCLPVAETGEALLVDIPDLGERVWIPKSVIHEDSEVWRADWERGELVVEDWFADERGWI